MGCRLTLARTLAVCAGIAALATLSRGQCLDWSDDFGLPGVDEAASSATVFDDGLGGGPALIVGGQFSVAGQSLASGVARWTGAAWEPLGSGLGGGAWSAARAFATFDDGSGPALYVVGGFSTAGGLPAADIARWDGIAWSAVGGGFDGHVRALVVFDDGQGGGPRLVAGGLFTTAGGAPARNLASWDGTSWSELGDGVPGANASVNDLVVHDDGAGPALFVGGGFTQVGTIPASSVARWDGTAWSALGAGTSGSVQALAVYDDGGGAQLYAGGEFTQAGGKSASRVARWDGGAWWPLGAGVDDRVHALGVHDDGSGAALFVGGQFKTAGGLPASGIARWSGSGWSSVGGGLQGFGRVASGFASYGAGGGPPALIVCGDFDGAGSSGAPDVAAWDGASWSSLGSGEGTSLPDSVLGVNAFAEYDDGSGPALHAGGLIASAGATLTMGSGLARWDGAAWSALPPIPWTSVQFAPKALAVFDPGTGPGLYVGTDNVGVAMWNGSAWDPTQSIWTDGYWSGTVNALAVHDDGSGPALYVGGGFDEACAPYFFPGGVFRWDGQSCSAVGSGPGDWANALLSFDDGGGPALYAGCGFVYSNPPQGSVSRWDGATWTTLGGVLSGRIHALAGFDDGGGPALYAGGDDGVLRWDGASWIPIGSGDVRALAVHDDGTGAGPALYAAGRFDALGQASAASIARWDGASWAPLGLGIEVGPWHSAYALRSHDDGAGPRLWVGGSFHVVGGRPSVGVASWGEACGCTGTVYCTSKVSSLGCVPSMGSSGISNLTATQPLMLFATQVPSNRFGLLFYGKSGADAKPFLGGTLCVRPPVLRTPAQWSGGNPPPDDCSGAFAMDFKAYALSGVDPGLIAGVTVHAQYWYRDPPDPFGSGTTDAVAVLLCP